LNRPSVSAARGSAHAWYAVVLLFLTNVLNQVDRSLVGILLVPIKRDLGASDTEMGLLVGFAFVVFYTALGIPMARWADRGTRRTIVALSLAFWSAMTALIGLTRSFWELALARLGVGAGEAGSGPASHSLISDLFPPERRGRALALLGAGGYVGGSFGWLAGGWLESIVGWRRAFLWIGLPGVLLGLLIRATLREPPRGQMDHADADQRELPLAPALRALLATRSYVWLQVGGAIHVFGSYGVSLWMAAYFQRVHGVELHVVGTYLGSIGLVCGLLGAFLGGWASDRLSQRDARWFLWLPILATLAALPFTALFLLAPDARPAFAFYAPHALINAMYAGPIYAMTQAVMRQRLRALAAAVHLFSVNLIGLGLGPLFVGALNDALRPSMGDGAIRYTMLAAASGHALACIFLLIAARHVRADLARRDAPVPWVLREEGRT
jgi:predicted MFS family arabinose efflux permease